MTFSSTGSSISSSGTNANVLADTAMRLFVPIFLLEDETTIITKENETRNLRTTGTAGTTSQLQLSAAATIAWYCLLVSVLLPLAVCLGWCWYQRHRGHRRALEALESESQLARMEANLRAFSKAETLYRVRQIRSVLRERLQTVTEEQQDWKQPMNCCSCSICLEDYKVGDSVANSSDPLCSHCFHEDCILSWLVQRRNAFCPCCRRPFLCLPAQASIIASVGHITVEEDDVERSSHMESSVIVVGPGDDQIVADTLNVVVEDAVDHPTTTTSTTTVTIEMEQR